MIYAWSFSFIYKEGIRQRILLVEYADLLRNQRKSLPVPLREKGVSLCLQSYLCNIESLCHLQKLSVDTLTAYDKDISQRVYLVFTMNHFYSWRGKCRTARQHDVSPLWQGAPYRFKCFPSHNYNMPTCYTLEI